MSDEEVFMSDEECVVLVASVHGFSLSQRLACHDDAKGFTTCVTTGFMLTAPPHARVSAQNSRTQTHRLC